MWLVNFTDKSYATRIGPNGSSPKRRSYAFSFLEIWRGGVDRQRARREYEFGEHDREVITHYYSSRGSNLPPGLAKRGGNLPPGLEKQLERNGTLPPGLQKRVEPCPVELERQLPPLPAEYRRGVIGAHVVIFNRNTNVIVDVFKDVAH